MLKVNLLVLVIIISCGVNEPIRAAPSGFHHRHLPTALTKHRRITRSSEWGLSRIMTGVSTKTSRFPPNNKLIFEGVVAPSSRDVIIFPGEYQTINKQTNDIDEDNDIDLSGSFIPSKTTTYPIAYNLNALCTSYAQMRLLLQLNANATSGTYTFPNGTQITYARCEVILIKHP